MPPRRRATSHYRRNVDPEIGGLGEMRVVRNPVATRDATRRGIPVVTIQVQARRGLDEELINVEDSTNALVAQGFNLAYSMARRTLGRDGDMGGINPLDRTTIWLEEDSFERASQPVVLAQDVGVMNVQAAVLRGLEQISEYESWGLLRDWRDDKRLEMQDALSEIGFDIEAFMDPEVTRRDRAQMLRTFMEDFGEDLDDADLPPGERRRLGWFQLRTYLNVARMSIYYTFFMHVPVPGGWKDGLVGLSRNQIFRFAEIIPKEVTAENDLCLYLAVKFASHFVYDRGAEEVRREDFDIPKANLSWADPVRIMGNLRKEWGLEDGTNILEHLNALSLYFGAVIHLFEYESGGSEILCSTEDVKQDQVEAHRVVFIWQSHAYPVKKPHFLVQDSGKYMFCPVCFHTFKVRTHLFYHIERCSRNKAMDTIDYELRRKFEKRSYVGRSFVAKGVVFKKCLACHRLAVCGPGDLGGMGQEYCDCEEPLFIDSCGHHIALRCMKCQVVFPTWKCANHKCRMVVRADVPVDLAKVWVYDIESQLDTMPQDPLERFLDTMDRESEEDFGVEAEIMGFRTMQQKHTPNLIVMMSLGEGEILTFDTIAEFIDLLFSDVRFDGARFYAHNAGRYDTHFIVSELLQRGCVPQFVPGSSAGYTNMLLVTYQNRSFADSYRLFPQGLAALAKSFDLPLRKGRFPYRFNMLGNQDYVGRMPGLEWYDPWDLRGGPGEMQELMDWHAAEWLRFSDGSWSLQDQLYSYCLDDVRILRQVMLRGVTLFQGIFQGVEGLSHGWMPPLVSITNHLTLTSAVVGACLYGLQNICRVTLRDVDGVHMEQDRFFDMVLAYEHFYQGLDLQIVADMVMPETFKGVLRAYEVPDGKIRVYLDCFRCGCSICYPMKDIQVYPNRDTFGDLDAQVHDFMNGEVAQVLEVCQEDIQYLYTHDYQKIFDDIFDSDDDVARTLLHKVIDPYWPIDAREAMFGGHTEAGALFAQSYGRHKICKIDVNSMYPFVCAGRELPFGDPETIRMAEVDRGMLDRREYFGLVRAQFTPPSDLLFPILPRKVGKTGKLVFDCEPRVGTYTTVDVYHAMDLGYEVGEIYEIRHFPPSQRKVGLFADYVHTLFGVKARAKEENDPALYLLCKFALNSLWGKFGEKVHSSYYGFVSSVRGYIDFMHADTIKDGSREMVEVADEVYLVKGAYEAVVCDAPRYYHPELACFVLAHARKILHSAIYALGPGRFLYCDTDSIIYLHTEGQSTPSIGARLGEWDIEVAGWPERYIVRFYSCGPKAYCEEYSDGTHKICYKGVMGSVRNKNLLGPENFRVLVLDYLKNLSEQDGISMSVSTQDFSIRVKYMQDLGGVQVRSNYGVKKIRVVNEKRYVPEYFMGDLDLDLETLAMVRTLPFGMKGDLGTMAYVTKEDFSENFRF